MAPAGGGGAAPAPQAQGPQGEPARGEGGAWPWNRDWSTVPDPLGDEALPLVGEVYGWLTWANQGTTRGIRNRPFDAVLLWRDEGNQEVPLGGLAAPEDQERVLRSVIRAAWPDRGPTWPAFLVGGRCSASQMRTPTTGSSGPCATPSTTGATAGATRHRHSPGPHTSNSAGDGPDGGRETVGAGPGPPSPRPPPRYGVTEERAPTPAGGRAETTSAGGNLLPRSRLNADC